MPLFRIEPQTLERRPLEPWARHRALDPFGLSLSKPSA